MQKPQYGLSVVGVQPHDIPASVPTGVQNIHLWGHLQEYHEVGPQPQITHIVVFAFGWVWVGWTWFGHGQNQVRQGLVIVEIRMG
jgi:hypothetical protein